jgi:hypothetical protein
LYVPKFEEAIYVLHWCPALLPEENSGDQQAGKDNDRRALSRRRQREEGKEMKIDTKILDVSQPIIGTRFYPGRDHAVTACSSPTDQRPAALLKQQLMEEAVCLDCETSLKADRGGRDSHGLATLCVRRIQQENG